MSSHRRDLSVASSDVKPPPQSPVFSSPIDRRPTPGLGFDHVPYVRTCVPYVRTYVRTCDPRCEMSVSVSALGK